MENANVIDGYYKYKDFVECEPLPIVNIGDMVYFKYGTRQKKTKVMGVHHYFYLNEENGKTYHWMSVMVKEPNGKVRSIQGNWVIKEE